MVTKNMLGLLHSDAILPPWPEPGEDCPSPSQNPGSHGVPTHFRLPTSFWPLQLLLRGKEISSLTLNLLLSPDFLLVICPVKSVP